MAPNKKVPLIASRNGWHGHLDATSDLTQISEWWTKYPSANIGIATGRPSGIVVIEDDPRHNGAVALAALEQLHGSLPTTYTVRSGSGGYHRYFRRPELDYIKSKASFFGQEYPGVDVKADGGLVVAESSRHPNRTRYAVAVNQVIAELPQTWIRVLAAEQERVEQERAAQAQLTPIDFADMATFHGDGACWLEWALRKTDEGRGDTVGWLLAVQLLVNHIDDPERWLREYARRATLNPLDPFDDRSVARWLRSAAQSRIVLSGQPVRSQRQMTASVCNTAAAYISVAPQMVDAPNMAIPLAHESPENLKEKIAYLEARLAAKDAMIAQLERNLASCQDANKRLSMRSRELVEFKRSMVEAERRRQQIFWLPNKRLSLADKVVLDWGSRTIQSAQSRKAAGDESAVAQDGSV